MNNLILIFFIILTSAYAQADPPEKAAQCTACHGPEGKSFNDLWPNLAGQKRGYLLKQLKAFKSGERNDPLMGPQAMTLTEEEMGELAQYFSKL